MPQLRKVLKHNLKNSHTVKLGDWTTFYITVKREEKDTKEESFPYSVKKVNARVCFEKAFIEERQKTHFTYVQTLIKDEEE